MGCSLTDASTSRAPVLGRTLSTYLDGLRLTAAMAVFISHAALPRISGHLLPLTMLVEMADAAVMAFFVLSGFVISYAAVARDKGLADYEGARLARLWSVALPALAVTVVADAIGRRFDPSVYAHLSEQAWGPLAQLATCAVFANELWFTSIRPFSNGPYWSIGYEFWYYVLFGAAFYLRGRARWIAIALTCVLVMPKILALFPIWLLGVAAYRSRGRIGAPAGALIVLLSIAGVLAIALLGFSWRLYWWDDADVVRLLGEGYSRHLPSKYTIGFLVACNLAGFAAIQDRLSLRAIERPIRWLAGMTFSLYLLHYPLLHLYASVLPGEPESPARAVLLMALALLTVAALAQVTERQKRRARQLVDGLGAWISARFGIA